MLQWNDNFVKGMKKGDEKAFEQCYRLLSPTIYTLIIKVCKNSAVASDLLQDTFIDAFNNIDSYQVNFPFIAWLKRIAINNTLNYIKRQKKASDALAFIKERPIDEMSLQEEIIQANLLEVLLDKVTENDRLILWLFIVEQYSHEEIAVLVKKSPSYSKSIVSRCLQKLRTNAEVKSYAC